MRGLKVCEAILVADSRIAGQRCEQAAEDVVHRGGCLRDVCWVHRQAANNQNRSAPVKFIEKRHEQNG